MTADPWADVPPVTVEPGAMNGAARKPFKLLDLTDLDNLPAPRPLIDGTIEQGSVFLIVGYHGTLKSFVAQSWCASVATGLAWHDRPVSEPRRVLYVAAEGVHGLAKRFRAWQRWANAGIDPRQLMTHPLPINLGDPRAVAELVAIVRGEGFGFVALDTLAKCSAGLDENSARDAGVVLDALYRVREATGPTGVVGAVHHTGKADRETARGSSAIESGVDTIYRTTGDARAMTLTCTKQKDGPDGDRMALGFKAIDGTWSGVAATQLDAAAAAHLPGVAEVVTIVLGTMHSGLTTAEVAKTLLGRKPSAAATQQTRRRLHAALAAGLVGYIPPSVNGMHGAWVRPPSDPTPA